MFTRRTFNRSLAGSAALAATGPSVLLNASAPSEREPLAANQAGEDIFSYIQRHGDDSETDLYRKLLGYANEFKEGDEIVGVAAPDTRSRSIARRLLNNTRIGDVTQRPPYRDNLLAYISTKSQQWPTETYPSDFPQTLGQLKDYLLERDESEIRQLMPDLSSDAIGCVVKLMSNSQLIHVGSRIFNPLPGSRIGSKGYLGARIQPNSPTDNLDDIRWQVFNGWAFGVGDVLLGNNPVSSTPESVSAIERTLQDLLQTFELADVMPHCVLSHIDVQEEVEQTWPNSTALWFQSIAGCDSANKTFDIDISKMRRLASQRKGKFGLYFETGQGADFTNGHSHGFDMVLHESRKYGFARQLKNEVADTLKRQNASSPPWVHLNDVAGFIGPEVFRTKQQLVRCCLEDIVMGKLHGLCIGLDVCSTLHMDVSLDDLQWCLDEIMPACPAYLMALPTNIDPMLGYLTTSFQDHVRLREKFGFKVNDRMWRFFQEIQIIDANGKPTQHFGDPIWVYEQYLRRKGDMRHSDVIRSEARRQLNAVADRGVFVAEGTGQRIWEHAPKLQQEVERIYRESKKSIWAELDNSFIQSVPNSLEVATRSEDRTDYILHPESGETLANDSERKVQDLASGHAKKFNVQIVISDGLNALAIAEPSHLREFLPQLRSRLETSGFRAAPENIVVRSGRVRAGYRIGEMLFAGRRENCSVLHVIGERPGTGHQTFSVYQTTANGKIWAAKNKVDHNITKVVSGIASTALTPVKGANETYRLLAEQVADLI